MGDGLQVEHIPLWITVDQLFSRDTRSGAKDDVRKDQAWPSVKYYLLNMDPGLEFH